MIDRRLLLKSMLGTGAISILGVGCDSSMGPTPGGEKADDFLDVRFIRSLDICELSFTAELVDDTEPHVKHSRGHNTRQFTRLSDMIEDGQLDLRYLTSDALVNPQSKYYIRTEAPDQLHLSTSAEIANFETLDQGGTLALAALRDAWRVRVHGEVSEPIEISIAQFESRVSSLGATMMECAGNDEYSNFRLMSAAHWDGLRFADFLDLMGSSLAPTSLQGAATHVKISGFDDTEETDWNRFLAVESTPGASWIFSIEELLKQGAFFATAMQGETLALDHGFPIRLVVPRYYGCTCIKWMNDIEFLAVDDSTETTDQMREFSDRTNQAGVPELLKDHRPPAIDQALTPIKVEEWTLDGVSYYRTVGLMWGGEELRPKLSLGITRDRLLGSDPRTEIDLHYQESSHSDAYTLWWSNFWRPQKNGKYILDPQILDSGVRARRLRDGYYRRGVVIG
tara:strand:+ start:43348 stop:44706 length:1359 start_codon:yes stop_codon:yes gene_type:complete